MFKTVQIEELGGAGAPGPWQLRIDYESQNMELPQESQQKMAWL